MQVIIGVMRILPLSFLEFISYHQSCLQSHCIIMLSPKLHLLAFPKIIVWLLVWDVSYSKGQSLTSPIQIRFMALSQAKPPPTPSILSIFVLCSTRLPPFHLICLIFLLAFGPPQRLLTVWWRHSGQKRLIASTARAAWPGCWRTGEEQTEGGGGHQRKWFFYSPPPPQEEEQGVYWWCDPAVEAIVWERKIDGWSRSWSPQLSAWLG